MSVKHTPKAIAVEVAILLARKQMKHHLNNVDNFQQQRKHSLNKVTDRRLRPRCCRLGSYFKWLKSNPVRPLACNWYYCAPFIAKPKAACALRFSWAETLSNLGLWANTTSSIKPEVHNASHSLKYRYKCMLLFLQLKIATINHNWQNARLQGSL